MCAGEKEARTARLHKVRGRGALFFLMRRVQNSTKKTISREQTPGRVGQKNAKGRGTKKKKGGNRGSFRKGGLRDSKYTQKNSKRKREGAFSSLPRKRVSLMTVKRNRKKKEGTLWRRYARSLSRVLRRVANKTGKKKVKFAVNRKDLLVVHRREREKDRKKKHEKRIAARKKPRLLLFFSCAAETREEKRRKTLLLLTERKKRERAARWICTAKRKNSEKEKGKGRKKGDAAIFYNLIRKNPRDRKRRGKRLRHTRLLLLRSRRRA